MRWSGPTIGKSAMLTIQHDHYIEPLASPIPKPGLPVAGELHQDKNKNKNNKTKNKNNNKNKNKKATCRCLAPLGKRRALPISALR